MPSLSSAARGSSSSEAAYVRSLRGYCKQAGIARYPGVDDGGRAEVGRHCFGSLARQKPEQRASLCIEPASDLNTNYH